jgi:hypothetical protein
MIALLPECAIFGKPLEVPGGMEQPVNWRSKPVREITPIPFSASKKLDNHHGLKLASASEVFLAPVAFLGAERRGLWRPQRLHGGMASMYPKPPLR